MCLSIHLLSEHIYNKTKQEEQDSWLCWKTRMDDIIWFKEMDRRAPEMLIPTIVAGDSKCIQTSVPICLMIFPFQKRRLNSHSSGAFVRTCSVETWGSTPHRFNPDFSVWPCGRTQWIFRVDTKCGRRRLHSSDGLLFSLRCICVCWVCDYVRSARVQWSWCRCSRGVSSMR